MKYEVNGDVIVNSRGDVMAHFTNGAWETKNDEVLLFIADLNKPKAAPMCGLPTPKVKKTKKEKPNG